MEKTGLIDYNVQFTDGSINKLITYWAREAGVRSLDKLITRICEKICLKIVRETEGYNEKDEIKIEENQLKDYVGIAPFKNTKMYNILPEGISVGLGYNAMGGSILFIECVKNTFKKSISELSKEAEKDDTVKAEETNNPIEVLKDNSNKKATGSNLTITGSLGNVMKESIQIAHTYAKYVMYNGFDNKFLESNDIHIHFPDGASKKDGPSAGMAITSALIS